MASLGAVKMEEDVKVKPDPADIGTPSIMEDEEAYEDVGELLIRGSAEQEQAWLAKLPKWLWEAWSEIDENEEITLGEVRVYNNTAPGEKDKLKIVLKDIPQHKSVPKRYDVTMNKSEYNNTVVFSEKDQPGFRGGQQSWKRDRNTGRSGQGAGGGAGGAGGRVSKRPYRSSIPKQTALAGYLKHEVAISAVENEEYRRLTAARFAALSKPKYTTSFTSGVDHTMHPGLAANQHFSTFVAKGSGANAKAKRRPQMDKAVRVSEEELLDLLHDCFKEYRYWSLRALKQRLRQPEAFIKGTLEKIASLNRSGSFSGQYRLRPEYESTLSGMDAVKEEGAREEDVDEEEIDEDEAEDFEDVKMEG